MTQFSVYRLLLGFGLSLLMTFSVYAGFLDDIKKLEDLKKADNLKRILETKTTKPKAERQKKANAHELEHQKAQAKINAKKKKKQAEQQKKQAKQKKIFDSYAGPPTIIGNIRTTLLRVRFNPGGYTLYKEKLCKKTTGDRYKCLKKKKKEYEYNDRLLGALPRLYPKEWKNIRSEFDKRRELPKLQQRLLKDANNNVRTTYRSIIGVPLRQYDFKRQGYNISFYSGVTGSFNVGTGGINLNRGASGAVFLPMAPDSAEKFKNQCIERDPYKRICKIYLERIFQVVNITNKNRGFLADIKRFRMYKHQLSAPGKETILSELVIEVPIAQLKPNTYYTTLGGDPAATGAEQDNIKLKF